MSKPNSLSRLAVVAFALLGSSGLSIIPAYAKELPGFSVNAYICKHRGTVTSIISKKDDFSQIILTKLTADHFDQAGVRFKFPEGGVVFQSLTCSSERMATKDFSGLHLLVRSKLDGVDQTFVTSFEDHKTAVKKNVCSFRFTPEDLGFPKKSVVKDMAIYLDADRFATLTLADIKLNGDIEPEYIVAPAESNCDYSPGTKK